MPKKGRSTRLLGALAIATFAAGAVVSVAAALRFTDESYATPTGVVGTPYSHRFGAPPAGESGAGCDPPYIFNIDSGALPPGLSLGSRNGVVSGTPTQAGTWSFWVSIRDDPTDKPWCNPLSAERQFSITIIEGLTIGPETTAPGTVGTLYSLHLTANLSAPKTWSIVAGVLPPGLSLGASDGVISGTPTTAGSYPFTVRAVVDSLRSDTKALMIVIRDQLAIVAPGARGDQASGRELRSSEVGVRFRLALTATGGSQIYTWSLSNGALPRGLLLLTSGSIIGRPREAGSFDFTVSVSDSEGRRAAVDWSLVVARRLEIVKLPPPAPAKVGRRYRWKLTTDGGVEPRRWKLARGPLPRGIRLDRRLGILSGVPRSAGRYRFRVQVVDSLGVRSTKTFLLKVAAPPARKPRRG